MEEAIFRLFEQRYTSRPRIFRSPGRINLIGEHTDYNHGYVLPAAIDRYASLAISKRDDAMINMYSCYFDETVSMDLADIRQTGKWADYIAGVLKQYADLGYQISGFDMVMDGDIPIGAGLSSSAAVECVTAYAVNELCGLGNDLNKMVAIARAAENSFVGVQCGIMDQYASLFGRENSFLFLDCRSLQSQYIDYRSDHCDILLFDTGVKHNLADSAYNERRVTCMTVVEKLQRMIPGIHSLRDVSWEILSAYKSELTDREYKRAAFVIQENDRVIKSCAALKEGSFDLLGELLFESHSGLRNMYEVSCDELDFLVSIVRSSKSVLGARMMGGGFGGCTINLIKKGHTEEVIEYVSMVYQKYFGKELKSYKINIGSGTTEIII